jgi:hypothetical protein
VTLLLLVCMMLGQAKTTTEPQILKTFYLRDASPQRRIEIVTALRQRLNLRYLILNTSANGITVRETPERVGQAENLLKSELRGSSAAIAIDSDKPSDEVHKVQTFYLGDSSTELDLVEIVTALRTLLNLRFVATNQNARAITLRDTSGQVALAGKVIADLNPSQPGVPVRAAAPIDAGKASETAQKDAPVMERQIALRNGQTDEETNEIVAALRTLLRNAVVEGRNQTIVVRDNENNLFVAERIVADLDIRVRK